MGWLRQTLEDVAKGGNDRPVEDVIIVNCGEVRDNSFYPNVTHLVPSSLLTLMQMAKRYLSTLSSSQLFALCTIRHANKNITLQDVDHDSPNTSSLPNADTAEEAGHTPVASTLVTMPDEPSILTGRRYAVVGLVLFTVATMMFVLMGGLRWLRRLTTTRRGRYRKVDGEDLEK